jgi:hypothetical protein
MTRKVTAMEARSIKTAVQVTVAAATMAVGLATQASAATTVAGTRYEVVFDGTASEDITQPGEGVSEHQAGTWKLHTEYPAGDLLWLPKAPLPHRFSDGFHVNGGDEMTGSGVDEANITDVKTDSSDPSDNYTCNITQVSDNGGQFGGATLAFVDAGGNLVVETDFRGFTNFPGSRQFTVPAPEGYSCSSTGGPLQISYPPDLTSGTSDVDFDANIPPASVGSGSFTLPVTDISTVNDDPYWAANGYVGPNFHITGKFTFKKRCDGTVTYTDHAEGKCGAAAGKLNTKIKKTTVDKRKKKVTIKFTGTGGSPLNFECKLDKKNWKKCKSPKTFSHLKRGKHTVQVRAKSGSKRDSSPAKKKFKV